MKDNHVHAWRMTSPHPFGVVVKYQCKSCPAAREERRPSTIERIDHMESILGIAKEQA